MANSREGTRWQHIYRRLSATDWSIPAAPGDFTGCGLTAKLVVTPEGFPLDYEVLLGNTLDKTTLKDFLHKIEKQYGKAERVWVNVVETLLTMTLDFIHLSSPLPSS